jgi:hypothetical protein
MLEIQLMSELQFFSLGVIWVGGFGLFAFSYPEKFLRLFRRRPTVSQLRAVRIMGAIELAVVFLSALSMFVMGFLRK